MTRTYKLVGIQGGSGSFNELAATTNLGNVGITDYQLCYLHTTENVFQSLEKKEIDLGQFAVRNSLGGEVEESTKAMAGRNFIVLAEYTIKIAHVLMTGPNTELSDIETIITHPQVLRQCKQNLKKQYSNIKLNVCEGDLVDPAKVAELLGEGKLPKSVATVSNKALAQLHGLNIIAENLQDADNNYTTFLLVALTQ